MARCATRGHGYEHSLEGRVDGRPYAFDPFECAIQRLAPVYCVGGCRCPWHDVQAEAELLCGAQCARRQGVRGISAHVDRQMSPIS